MRCLLAATTVLLLSAPVLANENLLTIDRGDLSSNQLTLAIEGSSNRLDIVQQHADGPGDANRMTVRVTGDLNGGASALSAPPLISGLTFGQLSQAGRGNMMNVDVAGSGNLFAFAQSGSGNQLSAAIQGTGNQMMVSQTGSANMAGIFQSGSANSVSITQSSW
ncbi:hypothetical protein U0C82_03995 [Fulvimarina sp. 2208YS6-2-32]|uniref:Curlin associated repeat-containing protein n=1 Tax=Fulvimarina uroteuthidis TaxID=3098149 RepID=A0ABU5HZM3_9HYPH|nr:hypothetical protein [Fulvimarina sp. 2208YS6-2-32]MDY8108312.1 hypothetical protein [Fulvimarina sp. 2208YS6-2-32]